MPKDRQIEIIMFTNVVDTAPIAATKPNPSPLAFVG
jgi:hypothetical protein